MYETISKTPPYPDINHDEYLATEICKGLRPNFNIKVPQLIVYLIKRCLDANPSNRPNAKDLSRTINEWNIELNQYRNKQPELVESELIKQMLDINDNSSSTNISNLPFTHPGAIYASRPFKFNNLPEPKNSNNYYENCDNITEIIYSGELSKSNSECLECEIVN
ncbi:uncharacterized protein OCT59_011721 [Rhizophagus irregularis]|nr:hypothetical protein OCT59_011721 [Rhizophagus irregularis]